MQIHNQNQNSVGKPSSKKKGETSPKTPLANEETKQSFLDILESVVPSHSEETRELNELWKELPDLEKQLIQSPDKRNLDLYKQHVKTIAEIVLKKNYKLLQATLKGRSDQRDLRYVKILDEKLDLLAKTMFSPQNTAFHILKQMDEIRGLLIDLRG